MEEIERLTQWDGGRAIVPARNVYDGVRVPAAFAFARRGLYRDRRADVEGMALKIGARFVEMDAGHNIHMEQPEKIAAVIRDMEASL